MNTTDPEVIRVLVVDDHPPFAQGLVKLLAEQPDFKAIGLACNGEEALALAKDGKPDVVVMDISMPGMNGIQATRRIKEELPEVAVLVLSAYGYYPYVLAALEAGAGGYLLKNVPMRELIEAIRALHSGETVLDHALAAKVLRVVAAARKARGLSYDLSSGDLELLKLGAKGMSNHEIAAKLFVSERTVQSHFAKVFGKLGVGSRIEAVVRAIKEGWLSPEDLP